jgi:post-segregation antitoxin (ccd killing protein)
MAKPTTFRIPDDLLREIEKNIRDSKIDRSVYLREVLQKGVRADKQERWLKRYISSEVSLMEVCRELNWTPWELFDQLKARDLYLNVTLEDWLDSAPIEITDRSDL